VSLIPPGSRLGVLGSGQLGRMFAIAARRLGYRVHVLSPDTDTPTGQVADVETVGPYDDLDAIARFARSVDVLTFEFENVPTSATDRAAQHVPVRPAGRVLYTTQNRLREKTWLRDAGIPVTPFAPVRSAGELAAALELLGTPAILKTASWGYDGKGQVRIETQEDAVAAWQALQGAEAILEAFIDLEAELSVIGVRGIDGSFAHYGPVRNTHRDHILDSTLAPGGFSEDVTRRAEATAHAILEKLDVVGVLCVEFFLARDGQLLVNELAPRPHNSGHYSIDACVTCQFEQQVRAVCGLPLGSTRLLRPAAMVNLLGDLWAQGEPHFERALASPEVHLHLYGKSSARPGRKMGHITALGATAEEAMARALEARAALTR
jgi:5-(carboxyamino)imidazole ribonucleotide synthase